MACKGWHATSEDFGMVWGAAPHAQRTFKANAIIGNQHHTGQTYGENHQL